MRWAGGEVTWEKACVVVPQGPERAEFMSAQTEKYVPCSLYEAVRLEERGGTARGRARARSARAAMTETVVDERHVAALYDKFCEHAERVAGMDGNSELFIAWRTARLMSAVSMAWSLRCLRF